MKAAVFHGAGKVEIVNVATPEVGPDEVLLRVHYCGICGSDIEAYHTGMYEPGLILGHEFAGEVVSIGERVEGCSAGTRVTVNNTIPCRECTSCLRDQPTLCDNLLMPGVTLNGGMAEYTVVHARALHRLPEGVSTRQGALIEPLAVALHGVRRSSLQPGHRVLVMGAGPIGLLALQCALAFGAKEVFVSEVLATRATMAVNLGASAVFNPIKQNLAVELSSRTKDEGPEIIYLATGVSAAFEEAVTLVAKGGQILVLGLGVEPVATDLLTVVLRELDIRGSYLGYDEFPAALDYMAHDRMDLESLITHEILLEDVIAKGFEALERPDSGAVKVLVKMIE